MSTRTDFLEVTSPDELRELLGPVVPRAKTKDRAKLHPLQRQWIEASPFCLIATAAANGSCDVSPKG